MRQNKYRLAMEMFPGGKEVSCKITDGFHTYKRGTVPLEKVPDLLAKVNQADGNEALLNIAYDFELTQPDR